MSLATTEAFMAKTKGSGEEPPTKAVKVDRALASKAQMIATDQGISLAEYVSNALRGVVERDWSKMVRRMGEQSGEVLGDEPKPKGPPRPGKN